ncbi:MAG: hypothetical protein GX220_06025 [Treponema sp.]|jgi:hypothetical protein|nr:hypothetical protein [Treponema sp.]
MKKSLLIVGKDYPAGRAYVTAAVDSQRNVVITKESQNDISEQTEVEFANWNRSSPISAKNLIIKAETQTGILDEALVIFDSSLYTSRFSQFDIETFSKADDELVRGYYYIVSEIVSRFLKKNHGQIVFVAKGIKDFFSKSIPVQSAFSAFKSLAEGFAFQFDELNAPKIFLVIAENETDDEIAQWLFRYIDEIENLKNKQKKKNIRWIKVGEKSGKKFF